MILLLRRMGAAVAVGLGLLLIGVGVISGTASADTPQAVTAAAVQPDDDEGDEGDDFEERGDSYPYGEEDDRQPAQNNTGDSRQDDDDEPDDQEDNDLGVGLGLGGLGGGAIVGFIEEIRWRRKGRGHGNNSSSRDRH